jgi:hypothetical protein
MDTAEPIDAEGSTRNKIYSAGEHLSHLVKIGYELDSTVIKTFVEEHSLHDQWQILKNDAHKN